MDNEPNRITIKKETPTHFTCAVLRTPMGAWKLTVVIDGVEVEKRDYATRLEAWRYAALALAQCFEGESRG